MSVYVAIDFDGTIVTHEFPRIGKPVPGALECMKSLQSAGIKLILNTMRSDGHPRDIETRNCLTEAVNYIKSNGIELFGINHNPVQDSWTASPKVYADFYIDDAAIGCPLIYDMNEPRPYVDWETVAKELSLRLANFKKFSLKL